MHPLPAIVLGLIVGGGCAFDPSGVPGSLGTDAAAPATDADTTLRFPYPPSNIDPGGLEPSEPVVLDCGDTWFDTGSLAFTNWCGVEPVPAVRGQQGGPDLVVLAVEGLAIAEGSTLQVTGHRALVLVVFGAADLAGRLLVSAVADFSGPGADPGCAGASGQAADGRGGGGGGGGFGESGAAGGIGGPAAQPGAGSPAAGDEALSPLRGGCPGGSGGPSGAAGAGGAGGGGGGGVQVSVAAELAVSGVVASPGGGGRSGSSRNGGGGGGSGGAILLEASALDLAASARLTANGGGGGQGGSGATGVGPRRHGDDGHAELAAPAAGGSLSSTSGGNNTTTGGDGGSGGAAGASPTTGMDGSCCASGTIGGGGGGGGAVGRVRLFAADGCAIAGAGAILSPAPVRAGACR